MKNILIIIGMLLVVGISAAQAAKGTGPGTSPRFNPNAKQGLTGMLAQPKTATVGQKINVTLFSYLPAGGQCAVYFKYPGLPYGPIKLLVGTSPYQVPNQYLPSFKSAGQYYLIAYTGTTGEHPCPYGKQVKVRVTIKSGRSYKRPAVRTRPKRFVRPRINKGK